ncbi:hypothetical protein L873DRAFT_1786678 [Choiromyces venosus 120613-1]|uniref:Uncharacterized protein n=1 Tax=Choiromyces venosus 120613-1 TaxID=1336337 RepID=A0A3N4K031_9PEZI|nr:hypothetical protein L873DRAFT_1786678 [Choiromyces venosus 120613-1]
MPLCTNTNLPPTNVDLKRESEEKKIMDDHSNPPTIVWVPQTPLQTAAVTVNALAFSKYLAHFPCIAPEDIAYARHIVEGLTLNPALNIRTFTFAVFSPKLLTSSEELDAYAALQNVVTAGAVVAHWRIVKAARELTTPVPFVKGFVDCGDVWRALEKCWGGEVVDQAKLEAGLASEKKEHD